ncbi:MAG: STAS domain-containing protein [Planctomycetes bacterium]|nr:STAS domain-containing protein [Planctomycetota bacterium]
MPENAPAYEIIGPVLVIRKDPRFDDPGFKQGCADLVLRPEAELVIDLSGVKFISSREISVLMTAVKRSKEAGKKLKIRCSVAVHGIFRILKLDSFLTLERVENPS